MCVGGHGHVVRDALLSHFDLPARKRADDEWIESVGAARRPDRHQEERGVVILRQTYVLKHQRRRKPRIRRAWRWRAGNACAQLRLISAGDAELQTNPRARSAKLRVLEGVA